jgi:hypothetical protein
MVYVGRGLAFGAGVLAAVVPAVAVTAPSFKHAVLLTAMAGLLGTALFTAALMKLRHFPWRPLGASPRTVAAALGLMSAFVGIGGAVFGDGAAGSGLFALATLVAALVCKRVVF